MNIFPFVFSFIFCFVCCRYHKEFNRKMSQAIKLSQSKYLLYNNENFSTKIPEEKVNPLISVVLPCFNVDKYLRAAIRSIQAQTFKNIEIIIVDDKSTDNTINVAQSLMVSDKRIHLLLNEQNRGIVYTRSKGVYFSKGKYLAFLDPDDIFLNHEILEVAYRTAVENDVDLLKFNCLEGNYTLSVNKYTNEEVNSIYVHPKLFQRLYENNGKIDHGDIYIWGKLFKVETLKKTYDYLTN